MDAGTLSDVSRRRTMILALAVALLDSMGVGLVIPVFPRLVQEVGHTDVGGGAQIGGLLFAAYSVMTFAFAPLLGALSDRFGRRPLLLLAVGGLVFDYLLQAMTFSLGWLFVGRSVAGLCGASVVIANACLSDVSTLANRARVFGYMGAAFGIGFVLGPAVGGGLGEFGTRVPFWAAAVLSAINFLFILLYLPETLAKEKRRSFRLRDANPLGILKIFLRYPGMLPYAGILALYFLGTAVYIGIWPFWGYAKFEWSGAIVGLTLATAGVAMGALQSLGVGPAVARLGEKRIVVIGLAVAALTCVGFGVVSSTGLVFVLLILHAPDGFVQPGIVALMSKGMPEDSQGALQGGIAAIQSLAFLFGTLLFSQIFSYFTSPAAPLYSVDIAFYGAGGVFVIALAWMVSQAIRHRRAALAAETAG